MVCTQYAFNAREQQTGATDVIFCLEAFDRSLKYFQVRLKWREFLPTFYHTRNASANLGGYFVQQFVWVPARPDMTYQSIDHAVTHPNKREPLGFKQQLPFCIGNTEPFLESEVSIGLSQKRANIVLPRNWIGYANGTKVITEPLSPADREQKKVAGFIGYRDPDIETLYISDVVLRDLLPSFSDRPRSTSLRLNFQLIQVNICRTITMIYR